MNGKFNDESRLLDQVFYNPWLGYWFVVSGGTVVAQFTTKAEAVADYEQRQKQA